MDVVRLARELEDLIRDADGERALVQRADRTTPKPQSGLALALAQPRACTARLAPPRGLLAIRVSRYSFLDRALVALES